MKPTSALILDLTDAPSAPDVALIEESLNAYNVARAIPYDERPLAIFARDPAGKALGGVTGHTNWGWLYLDCFWLPDDLRGGKGLGSRILKMAEAEAVRRGCAHARLYTYSFQAPGFYEKHGYERFGELIDYPPGHSQIWLRKRLMPSD